MLHGCAELLPCSKKDTGSIPRPFYLEFAYFSCVCLCVYVCTCVSIRAYISEWDQPSLKYLMSHRVVWAVIKETMQVVSACRCKRTIQRWRKWSSEKIAEAALLCAVRNECDEWFKVRHHNVVSSGKPKSLTLKLQLHVTFANNQTGKEVMLSLLAEKLIGF